MSIEAKRAKRLLAGVLAGAMALSVMPIFGLTGTAGALEEPTGDGSVCEDAPEAEPFTDVTDADPSQEEIECLFNSGITVGTSATTYSPNASVQRRQMALFLVRLADTLEENEVGDSITALPEGDGETDFTDIAAENEETQDAIDRLNDAGIALGTTATTFSPGDNVTREQMAAFIVRLQRFVAGEDSTPDGADDAFTDDDDSFAEEELNVLAEEGVYLGVGGGEVNPGDPITRRQMANVLIRKLQWHFEAGDITRIFAEDDTVATIRPELVSAAIVQTVTPGNATPARPAGTYVRYTFDEPIALGATPANFKVYRADSTLAEVGDSASIEPGGLSVVVRFGDQDTAGEAGVLSVATVVQGAVLDASGNSNPEGDAAIGTGAEATVTAGVTAAPDVTGIAAYRQGQAVGTTAVDITFDEAATVLNTTGFSLVLQNNTVAPCTSSTAPAVGAPSGGTVPGGSGTTTITVVCTNPDITGANPGGTPLSNANVARVAVQAGTVQDASAAPVANPLQTADGGNTGNTTGPDLVSATFVQGTNDSVLYVFDANVTATGAAALFHAYLSNGSQINGTGVTISATDPRQVLVTFGSNTALDTAVGASVENGAVTAGALGANQDDEVGVTNTTVGTIVPGRTAAPDLTGVALTAATGFSPATATFTFDQNVETGANITDAMFHLYTANGVRLTAADCVRGATYGAADSGAASASVSCAFGVTADATTNANVINAVLGTVEAGAVDDDDNNALTNPEGAETTTGGTGTPAA